MRERERERERERRRRERAGGERDILFSFLFSFLTFKRNVIKEKD